MSYILLSHSYVYNKGKSDGYPTSYSGGNSGMISSTTSYTWTGLDTSCYYMFIVAGNHNDIYSQDVNITNLGSIQAQFCRFFTAHDRVGHALFSFVGKPTSSSVTWSINTSKTSFRWKTNEWEAIYKD